jgi:hypothetical protein
VVDGFDVRWVKMTVLSDAGVSVPQGYDWDWKCINKEDAGYLQL